MIGFGPAQATLACPPQAKGAAAGGGGKPKAGEAAEPVSCEAVLPVWETVAATPQAGTATALSRGRAFALLGRGRGALSHKACACFVSKHAGVSAVPRALAAPPAPQHTHTHL